MRHTVLGNQIWENPNGNRKQPIRIKPLRKCARKQFQGVQINIMPTLPDYLQGVSWILHWSPAPPYGSPTLLDKMDLWAFMRLSLKFSPFFFSKFEFFLFIVQFQRHFCPYVVTDKDYFIIMMMKTNFDSMYLM